MVHREYGLLNLFKPVGHFFVEIGFEGLGLARLQRPLRVAILLIVNPVYFPLNQVFPFQILLEYFVNDVVLLAHFLQLKVFRHSRFESEFVKFVLGVLVVKIFYAKVHPPCSVRDFFPFLDFHIHGCLFEAGGVFLLKHGLEHIRNDAAGVVVRGVVAF